MEYSYGADGADPALLIENPPPEGGSMLVSDADTAEPLGVASFGADGTWTFTTSATRIMLSGDGRHWVGPIAPTQ